MDKQELDTIKTEIKSLLDKKEYDKVIKICSDEDYIKETDIQDFMIIALTRSERYEEGLEKVNEFLNKGYSARLEYKKIVLIQELNGIEEALKECDKVEYRKDAAIYYRKAILLAKLNRFKEAIEYCDKNKDVESKYKDMSLTLKNQLKKYITPEALLLTKISICKIDMKEIQSSNIDKWKKDLLLVAYYDKMFNVKLAFQHAKQLRRAIEEDISNGKYTESEKINKVQMMHMVYDKFLERRYRPFGITFFEEQLECKINPEYIEELRNTKKEKQETKKEEQKVVVHEEEKKEKTQKVIISSYGNVVNNRFNNMNKTNDKDIEDNRVKHNDILIKDYYKTEVITIGKYLYACMYDTHIRADAIKAYDNLENMVEKSIYDTKALEKFVNLLKRIHTELDINIDVVEDKYEKVIK